VLTTLGHGLVDNSIFVPDLAVAFWLALALTSVVSNQYAVASHVGPTAVVTGKVASVWDPSTTPGNPTGLGTRW